MKEVQPSLQPIVVECDLPHPPAQVWRALTEQDLLAAWLMPNDLRPEAGTRFRFRPEACEADDGVIDCEVLEAEPNRLLRWRQTETPPSDPDGRSIDSVVTVELTVRSGGTHLRLTHDSFNLIANDLQHCSTPRACATVIPFKASRRSRARQLGAIRIVARLRAAA